MGSCQSLVGSELKYCTPSSGQYYMTYYDENAHHPYGATDIDDYFSAPTGLTPEACMARCSADDLCSCVTQERSSGKCWKRANCHPEGWKSPHSVGYNVYMKTQQRPRQSAAAASEDANATAENADAHSSASGGEAAANASELLLYP